LRAAAPARVLPLGRAFPANTLTLYGIEDFRGHDAVGSAAHAAFAEAMSSAPPLRQTWDTYARQAVNAAGIDVVVAEGPIDAAGLDLIYASATASPRGTRTHVYRNTAARPRAFFVARPAAGSAPALDLEAGRGGRRTAPPWLWRLVEASYPGIDRFERRGRQVSTAAGPPATIAALVRRFDVVDAQGAPLGSLIHTPLFVRAELDVTAPGHLVLLDQDLPGWQPAVDDVATPGERADRLFRAVAVPAGHHVITWTYRPLSFAVGFPLSLAALAWTIVWWIRTARPSRRAQGAESAPTSSSDSWGT